MPYTPTSWSSGVTPVDAPEQNNIETQYKEATLSLNPDLGVGVVLSGCTGVKNGSNPAQLNFTGGVAYVEQVDGTFRERLPATQNFTVSVASTTYYLDLGQDGVLSFATSHSGEANYISLLQLTTDSSAHINVITDVRPLKVNFFPGAASNVNPQFGGDNLAQLKSNGGGAAGFNIWVGTTDPGSNAQEGDLWFNF